MSEKADRVEDLSREDTARLVMDMFHRIIIHYSLWFTEVRHQMGMEKALFEICVYLSSAISGTSGTHKSECRIIFSSSKSWIFDVNLN